MEPAFPLDVVRVGDPSDLPLGLDYPAILTWAERNDRVLVTRAHHRAIRTSTKRSSRASALGFVLDPFRRELRPLRMMLA